MNKNFIFLGPPGAGKGTLAAQVAEEYKIHKLKTDFYKQSQGKETLNEIDERAIAELAQQHLHGVLALEINENLGAETCNLLKTFGFNPTLLKDFRDKDRFIIAMKH